MGQLLEIAKAASPQSVRAAEAAELGSSNPITALTLQKPWSRAPLDAERRFAQPNAKLFPCIGRKVWTPLGPGTLLQVFADRVTVVLDFEISKCSFFAPGQIEPVSWELPE